jgi:hypothetical protein
MLENARWFSRLYPSPDCCLRRFLAVTCPVAMLTHPIPLSTAGTEIAMSSANSPLVNAKSSKSLDREQAARDRSYEDSHSWWPF